MRYHLLLPILLLLSQPVPAQQREELHFQLSYSGLITGFIWKDLADVTMRLTPEASSFRKLPAMTLGMEVTTADYRVAEAIHPLRYHWTTTLSQDLQRTLQISVIDDGMSDTHDVFWYDWEKNLISGFRKRKQLDVGIPIFDEQPIMEWEKDYLLPPPKFISPHPPVAPGLSYLIMTDHLKEKLTVDAIDPLTMIHKLRQHDFHRQPSTTLQIIYEDEQAPYTARRVKNRNLTLGDCTVEAIQVEINRSNESGEEGAMTLWLSDDAQHLPLRIDIEAPLGELHVKLQSPIPTSCSNEGTATTPRQGEHNN